MKLYLILLVALFAIINAAFGAVGGSGMDLQASSTTSSGIMTSASQSSSGQSSFSQSPAAVPSSMQLSASPQTGYASLTDSRGNYLAESALSGSDGSTYSAPQVSGPIQEQMTPEALGLSLPQMDGFTPDSSLDFVAATPSGSAASASSSTLYSSSYSPSYLPSYSPSYSSSSYSSDQAVKTGSYSWYYPGSVVSANRFYVQTGSGLGTVGGCGYGGYLPLWADIKASGNFFIYEWYPGHSSPLVQWMGWTGSGWKKGWFGGDITGWHVLCYNSGIWSNYVYIYVYPQLAASAYASTYAGTSGVIASGQSTALPSGAPTPPDPGAENLILPDYNLYQPAVQSTQGGYSSPIQQTAVLQSAVQQPTVQQPVYAGASSNVPVLSTTAGLVENPIIAGTPSINPAQTGAAGMVGGLARTSTTCTSSTVVTGGVCSSNPCVSGSATCASQTGCSAPAGYVSQLSGAVYPLPSVCKCNEYYVESCSEGLKTVAGVYRGDWLPLWSKVSRPGVYWSFEWTVCEGDKNHCRGGYYCSPDVKNFGSKNAGWYQTWFKGNDAGWHILSFYSNDWSNYVYIYVWPAD